VIDKTFETCLRGCQGSYRKVLESGYLLDSESDDWHYKYILDLDNNTFSCDDGQSMVQIDLQYLPDILYPSNEDDV
jgi:hypothetical protein